MDNWFEQILHHRKHAKDKFIIKETLLIIREVQYKTTMKNTTHTLEELKLNEHNTGAIETHIHCSWENKMAKIP